MSETTQRYKEDSSLQKFSKKLLLNAIDFLRYKVKNDSLTVSEGEALMRFFCESLNLQGTADEFAAFYGKSKNNVRVVICNKMLDSPIRKVLYPFSKFAKVIPKSWFDGIESQK